MNIPPRTIISLLICHKGSKRTCACHLLCITLRITCITGYLSLSLHSQSSIRFAQAHLEFDHSVLAVTGGRMLFGECGSPGGCWVHDNIVILTYTCRRVLRFTAILSSFFFFSSGIPPELAKRNSTKTGHMLGSKCDLKMHVRNLG